MRAKSATPMARAAARAASQYGVVSRRQLYAAGLSSSGIGRRVESGQLHRVHQGVYAVGHRYLSNEGRWMAAVLACGAGAVLSHRSAASLWKMLPPGNGSVEVSVPTAAGRSRRVGIRIHRHRAWAAASMTSRGGIPVTTPAQTIADLRGRIPPSEVRRAIRQAGVLGLRTQLQEPNAPTRSELEDCFLRLCSRRRLPTPEVNVRIGPYEVDFLWRPQRLIVETDGYRSHRGPQAFEDDHARDLELRSLGYDVRRFSYRQVTENAKRVARAVHQALEATPAPSFDPASREGDAG
jgi:very-short-patch-repair endonuclease